MRKKSDLDDTKPIQIINDDFENEENESALMSRAEKYKDYLRIAVIAYNEEQSFYENCGFIKSKDASPMFITTLWT